MFQLYRVFIRFLFNWTELTRITHRCPRLRWAVNTRTNFVSALYRVSKKSVSILFVGSYNDHSTDCIPQYSWNIQHNSLSPSGNPDKNLEPQYPLVSRVILNYCRGFRRDLWNTRYIACRDIDGANPQNLWGSLYTPCILLITSLL
jgi:hypothetical protein